MKGQQEMNIISTAKHFPGHGDTSTDSHKTLPIIKHKKERILNVELKPFINLINNGLESVMIAHLEVIENYISTSTINLIILQFRELLKNDLGFKGLIITDALEMKGLSTFKSTGNLDMLAFKAGNDILLMSENVSEGVNSIMDEYNKGSISEIKTFSLCKKILKAKYKVGLNKSSDFNNHLDNDLNNISDKILNEQLVERSYCSEK